MTRSPKKPESKSKTVAGPELAKLRLQVDNKDVEWDVVDMGHATLPTAVRLNLLEPINEMIVDWEGIVEKARSPFAIGATIYAGGIGYHKTRKKARNNVAGIL